MYSFFPKYSLPFFNKLGYDACGSISTVGYSFETLAFVSISVLILALAYEDTTLL